MAALVNPNSVVPLYKQILKILSDRIADGVWGPGEKLPPESALMQEFGVSRITVRAAIEELTDSGVLVRSQGKGTFVAAPKSTYKANDIIGFTRSCRLAGKVPTTKLIKAEWIYPTQADIDFLNIPEDRQKRGLILSAPLSTNFVIKEFYKEPYSKNGILNSEAIEEYGQRIIDKFDVRSGEGIHSLAGKLSGGNQQKAIIGREIEADPELLIAVQPTRGLDVGAIEFIHNEIVKERDRGKAVLLVSFELDEIFNLSDRIAVMNAGRLIDIVNTKDTDEHAVGLMMAGIKKEERSEV